MRGTNGYLRRNKARPGGRRPQQSGHQSFDSHGPEGRVRGTAGQVYEKYMALAKDAMGSGDRVLAESHLQFAEHYHRILSENNRRAQEHQRDHQKDHQEKAPSRDARDRRPAEGEGSRQGREQGRDQEKEEADQA